MKVLYVGHLDSGQTSAMRMEALRDLGHDVTPVSSQAIFRSSTFVARQLRQRFNVGPGIDTLNDQVIQCARQVKPDLLWADKQEYLRPETLEEVRKQGTLLVFYTPDPYFTLAWKRTALTEAALPLYDVAVTSKRYEMDDFRRVSRSAAYMPLGYGESTHRPLSPANGVQARNFSSDIGFLGGWEPRREKLLDGLAGLGAHLSIWGYAWDHLRDGRWNPRRYFRLRRLAGNEPFAINKNTRLASAVRGGEVYGDQYAWALSCARISVGFLRQICPDQHTTRTFEIPACASMMIADRTEEHMEFFREGTEAEFFSSEEELVEKVRFYLANESARERIALAGYERSIRSGYSYRQRMEKLLTQLKLTM